MGTRKRFEPMEAAFALPLGFAGMLVIGVVAVGLPATGRAGAVLAFTCVLMFALSVVSAPITVLPLAVVGWFTVAGFAREPIGDLHGVSAWSIGSVAAASLAGGSALLVAGWARMERAQLSPSAAHLRTCNRRCAAGPGWRSRRIPGWA